MKVRKEQTVCEWMNTNPDTPKPDSIIGLAINSLGKGEINGLRHPKSNTSSGWFIWSGEYSENENFFSPVCMKHLNKYLDDKVIEYLDLPSGYRFLVAGNNYEDVWFDEKLLNI